MSPRTNSTSRRQVSWHAVRMHLRGQVVEYAHLVAARSSASTICEPTKPGAAGNQNLLFWLILCAPTLELAPTAKPLLVWVEAPAFRWLRRRHVAPHRPGRELGEVFHSFGGLV